MYRFIPPLVVLTPHDSNVGVQLRARLLTVLRVVYAIVRVSSGWTMVRSSMWISSVAGISKVLCTSEVTSATHTSVKMPDFHCCGSVAVN